MEKTFEYFLNQVKSQKINEDQDHWMVGTIPSYSEWEKVPLSSIVGHETYRIKLVDKYYILPDGKIDWFKDNIGKTIKFKYNSADRQIMRVEIVNDNPPIPNESTPTNITNEAMTSEDLKNILIKFTKFLYDEGIAKGVPNDEHLFPIINKFIG